jgi:hypothetical protein
MLARMTIPKPKLRRFQFSLRTLLIVVTLCAILCSWLAVKTERVQREREAAAEIEKLGGKVTWVFSPPSGSAWLQSLRSLVENDDVSGHVIHVYLNGTQATDTDLEHLKRLPRLLLLSLDQTKVTDAGLEHLEGLSELWILRLHSTQITDAGLEHLKGLNQLGSLELGCTRITDAGLQHLEGLTKLTRLDLTNTRVTNEGVEKLQQVLPTCEILH